MAALNCTVLKLLICNDGRLVNDGSIEVHGSHRHSRLRVIPI